MSARSLRPVVAVATVAVAALSCYLVSLRVATERASLEDVETKIVLAQRDIRTLQTEIGTRGRLEQLERWNVKVLALSAPKADQFLDGGYQLARLARPSDEVKMDAPIVLAAAPKPSPPPLMTDDDADLTVAHGQARRSAAVTPGRAATTTDLLHVASYAVPSKAERAPAATKATRMPTAGPRKIATSDARQRLSTDPLAPKGTALHEAGRAGPPKDKVKH